MSDLQDLQDLRDLRSLRERLRLYVVTHREIALGRSDEEVVIAAVRGGATAIQLRGKGYSAKELVRVGLRLKEICSEAGVLFIVNDRVDVALAVDADGVHVGQEDIPARTVRRLIGPEKILGVTAEDSQQARRAEADGADYLGTAAVFPTPIKVYERPPLGIAGFAAIARSVKIPVVAIGGIGPGNAAEVLRAGAAGIAVVSAVVGAPDVARAARELAGICRRPSTG